MTYHVQIRESWTKSARRYGLTEEELRNRFVLPRERGEPVWVDGEEYTWDVAKLEIYEGPPTEQIEPALGIEWLTVVQLGESVTDSFVRSPPGVVSRNQPIQPAHRDQRRVVVVHGRDNEARAVLFDFLRALDLRPQEWEQLVGEAGGASPYTGIVIERAFEIAAAVVVLFTPDDEAKLHEDLQMRNESGESLEPDHERQLTGQPRPNAIFEAGMALALHPERTVIVEVGHLRPISDLAGRHTVRLAGEPGSLQALAQRLEDAGCVVDRTGTDWLMTERVGRLSARTRRSGQTEVRGRSTAGDPPDSYMRSPNPVAPARLEARVYERRGHRYLLEVRNAGSVAIESVAVQLPASAHNWHLQVEALHAYPISSLQPDEHVRIPLVVAKVGGPATIEITVGGFVEGQPYERQQTVSVTDSR